MIKDVSAGGGRRRASGGVPATGDEGSEHDFVFIGGAGRSGTTLLRAMLDAHPGIHCGPEVKLVTAICGQRAEWERTLRPALDAAGIGPELVDRSVRAFLATLLGGLGDGSKRIAEKTPHDLLYMAYLGRLFPRARFLHVLRDGRAVAASLVKQRWVDPATGKRVWYCRDLGCAARYWAGVVREVRRQADEVPGRCLEVRYESLVAEPETEMRRVLVFLDEPWDDAVLRHHEADLVVPLGESSSTQVAYPVHGLAVDRWRQELGPEDVRAIRLGSSGLLEELGYCD